MAEASSNGNLLSDKVEEHELYTIQAPQYSTSRRDEASILEMWSERLSAQKTYVQYAYSTSMSLS